MKNKNDLFLKIKVMDSIRKQNVLLATEYFDEQLTEKITHI